MTVVLVVLAVLFAVLGVLAAPSVRVLREYEPGVVFRLGRLIGQKRPGLILLIPVVDRMGVWICGPSYSTGRLVMQKVGQRIHGPSNLALCGLSAAHRASRVSRAPRRTAERRDEVIAPAFLGSSPHGPMVRAPRS